MKELLKGTSEIAPAPDRQPVLAIYPASGFSALPLRIG
jgi:hypothetical protein